MQTFQALLDGPAVQIQTGHCTVEITALKNVVTDARLRLVVISYHNVNTAREIR